MNYVGETVFDNKEGTCACSFQYIMDYEKNEYRDNPPFVVQEMRLDDDTIYCSNEHFWDENPEPEKWNYSEGMICVGLWRIKYK